MFDDCDTIQCLRQRYAEMALRHREDSVALGIINEDYLRRLETITEAEINRDLIRSGIVRGTRQRGRPRK